jgi:hypothetical protein
MGILASTRIRQTGEFSASTRIRQIRRRVAIAYPKSIYDWSLKIFDELHLLPELLS